MLSHSLWLDYFGWIQVTAPRESTNVSRDCYNSSAQTLIRVLVQSKHWWIRHRALHSIAVILEPARIPNLRWNSIFWDQRWPQSKDSYFHQKMPAVMQLSRSRTTNITGRRLILKRLSVNRRTRALEPRSYWDTMCQSGKCSVDLIRAVAAKWRSTRWMREFLVTRNSWKFRWKWHRRCLQWLDQLHDRRSLSGSLRFKWTEYGQFVDQYYTMRLWIIWSF